MLLCNFLLETSLSQGYTEADTTEVGKFVQAKQSQISKMLAWSLECVSSKDKGESLS